MCGVATNMVCSSSFLYKLPLRGIRRFRHCFRRFGQQTNKKATVTVKTVTKTAKTVTRTANPLGVGVAAGMLVHEGHKALCTNIPASGCRGRIIPRGISTYPVHQKALHHKKGVGQSFRTGPHLLVRLPRPPPRSRERQPHMASLIISQCSGGRRQRPKRCRGSGR